MDARTDNAGLGSPPGFCCGLAPTDTPLDHPCAFLLALCCVLPLTGCKLHEWAQNGFKVGPNYCRPMAPVASRWIDFEDPRILSEEMYLGQWWHVFEGPTLDSLIDTAYQQNVGLRVAGTRILEAQAIRGYALGDCSPRSRMRWVPTA